MKHAVVNWDRRDTHIRIGGETTVRGTAVVPMPVHVVPAGGGTIVLPSVVGGINVVAWAVNAVGAGVKLA